MNHLLISLTLAVAVLGACGGDDDTTQEDAATSTSATTSTASTTTETTTTQPPAPAPPPPTNPSTLEQAGGGEVNLLLDQVGEGPGRSDEFTPTGAAAPSQQAPGSTGMVRLRVEWSCAEGSAITPTLRDQSGDISGPLENGFDGPIPVSEPPAYVDWAGDPSCSWHVRALDQ